MIAAQWDHRSAFQATHTQHGAMFLVDGLKKGQADTHRGLRQDKRKDGGKRVLNVSWNLLQQ